MMKYLLLVLFLTGCATSEQLTSTQKQALIMQQQSVKTFEIQCEQGCRVSYKDPRDKIQLPRSTNGYDVANTVIKAATAIAPWATVGVIATEGLKQSGTTYSGSYNTDSTHTPTVVNQPAPTVVTQPEPVIVEPTVITSEVQVVNPVVVGAE